jgi:hypothetical protein
MALETITEMLEIGDICLWIVQSIVVIAPEIDKCHGWLRKHD